MTFTALNIHNLSHFVALIASIKRIKLNVFYLLSTIECTTRHSETFISLGTSRSSFLLEINSQIILCMICWGSSNISCESIGAALSLFSGMNTKGAFFWEGNWNFLFEWIGNKLYMQIYGALLILPWIKDLNLKIK